MTNTIFSISLWAVLTTICIILSRVLSAEKWQFIAALPNSKNSDGSYNGTNLTYYGLFTANALLISAAIALVLLHAIGYNIVLIILTLTLVLIICMPASKIVAYIVEKRKGTLTIGGAVFTGFIAAPVIVGIVNITAGSALSSKLELLPFLAALTAAYAIGEGTGRLACISFGCCYGKKIENLSALFHKVLSPFSIKYYGKTKKIIANGGIEGCATAPIQTITSLIYISTGAVSTYLFLEQMFILSFFISLSITQIWRFLSEFLRDDYRGDGKISAYQLMSLMVIPYYIIIALSYSHEYKNDISLLEGIAPFKNPITIIALQILWLAAFIHSGKSTVTSSIISFKTVKNRQKKGNEKKFA
ncbi:MAG: prolipoprotein diacylglyceryl transferase [Spirochaetes bacterium]|nr:prolipoprotein diacylglyceryl transferase [Spirochaetota bacterium]MBN2769914.1 prolipoprotein diacylglyceryl transferase [Spirochaetota bacterium]